MKEGSIDMATCLQKGIVIVLVASMHWACMQTVTEYEYQFNPDSGFGPEKLEQDKEVCQAAQRAVGIDENRIAKCLEAKGWIAIKRNEPGRVGSDNSAGSTLQW
jgi:hypothetical protein